MRRQSSARSTKGFTIIELMTAIVILTVLVMVGVPNFIGRVNKAKEAQLMSNMRMLVVMLETYRADWMEFPQNLADLSAAADAKGYNKEGVNPFNSAKGKLGSPQVWAIDFVNPGPAGYAGYEYVGPTQYRVYGYDKDGLPLKRDGQIFKLTNG
ncbi:MAG: prepilin-type N-terminal cleavage/methylation domain-containing protein [Candidatus Sericytochromatia bacterium]|nr:prepilin-type N-terminal cleavage/methylation domain-containing protein [Candidatus Sericytochromatia bacterium]